MKYVVNVGIKKFTFKDALTAVAFAERAKQHFTPTEYDRDISVEIELVNDEPDMPEELDVATEAENKED